MWGAIIGALISAAASAAIAAASKTKIPESPTYGEATRASLEAEIQGMPALRQLAALAAKGESGTVQTPGSYVEKDIIWTRAPVYGDPNNTTGPWVIYNPQEWAPGGKYAWAGKQPWEFVTGRGKVYEGGEMPVDFTGKGDADIAIELARQNAQGMLDLQQKYGKAYVEEAKRQQAIADPEGVQSRKTMYEQIMQDLEASKTAQRPVASELDAQILADLNLGRGVDPAAMEAIQRSLASRGESGALAGIQQSLESGSEAEKRLYGRQTKATSYLGSGVSPEDVSYRRRQQAMANMAAFLRGETPAAQFAQLSGAQQGATPIAAAQPLPGVSQANLAAGTAQAAQNYGYNIQNQLNQISPWYAGLGLALKGAGIGAQIAG